MYKMMEGKWKYFLTKVKLLSIIMLSVIENAL